MKTILLLIMLITALAGCSRDCDPKPGVCSETPPTDELCAAYYNRWFYNSEKNECEQIGYSGCSQKGFATQQECESCKCR